MEKLRFQKDPLCNGEAEIDKNSLDDAGVFKRITFTWIPDTTIRFFAWTCKRIKMLTIKYKSQ